MEKTQLIFIPFSAIGHLTAPLELAKMMTLQDRRLSITIIIMKFPFGSNPTLTSDSDSIRFVTLPPMEVVSPVTTGLAIIFEYIKAQIPQVRAAVSEITRSGSARLGGFVLDMFCTSMIDVADEFGVPSYIFFTCSAAFLGFKLHVQFLHDNEGLDLIQFKNSDSELEIPSYVNSVPGKVYPSVMFDKEGGFADMFIQVARTYRQAKGIMVNTFAELEPYAVQSFSGNVFKSVVSESEKLPNDSVGVESMVETKLNEIKLGSEKSPIDIPTAPTKQFNPNFKRLFSGTKVPPVYPIGPIINTQADSIGASDILSWLDDQPPSSVIFLCFGSEGSFSLDQVKEIAHGLERSGHRFLWSLRQPPQIEMGSPSDYVNLEEVLPEGFLDRTAKIGKVIGWAPQVAVLAHSAIGGFVSHCGWNSTLESIWYGIPVATWPLYSEQQINAFHLVKDLGLAIEIKMDYHKDCDYVVKAQEIEIGLKNLMNTENKVRKKVEEMKQASRKVIIEGGSSHSSLGHFIEDMMNNIPCKQESDV